VAPSSGQSRLNFSIDDTDVGFYQAPAGSLINNQLFWTSPNFDEASHKLVITGHPLVATSESVESDLLTRLFYIQNDIHCGEDGGN
jgi:hypothetical protein